MKIFLGTDHAGFEMKEKIKTFLIEAGYEVEDKGSFEFNSDDDYPDFIAPVAKEVSNDPDSRGIVLGGSGQGEAILANRLPSVRAVVYYGGNQEIIKLSREHNDSNILSLGARFLDGEDVESVVLEWLKTPFSGEERHKRRIGKIEKITE